MPQRHGWRGGPPPDRGRRGRSGDPSAGQLGRRGGRSLRPQSLRVERSRRVDGGPGRAAAALGSRWHLASRRTRGARGRPRPRTRGALGSAARPPTSSSTSSRAPSSKSLDLPLGVVLGTFGVERHRITWRGQAAHAGSTPMDQRRDALAGAAKLALALREIAARAGDGAVCTSGGVVCRPGIVTSVVETAEQLLDQRHLDAGSSRPCSRTRRNRAAASRRKSGSRSSSSGSGRSSRSSSTDTLLGFCEEAVRRGRGNSTPAAFRPPPRRGGGVPRRRADRDALRPRAFAASPTRSSKTRTRSTSSSRSPRSTDSPRRRSTGSPA